jgi:hypothetical protein
MYIKNIYLLLVLQIYENEKKVRDRERDEHVHCANRVLL